MTSMAGLLVVLLVFFALGILCLYLIFRIVRRTPRR